MSEKKTNRKSKRTRQKNKGGDRKGESNDSPEISHRGAGHKISRAFLQGTCCAWI